MISPLLSRDKFVIDRFLFVMVYLPKVKIKNSGHIYLIYYILFVWDVSGMLELIELTMYLKESFLLALTGVFQFNFSGLCTASRIFFLMYTLKNYFQSKFNISVYKITIDAGFTCPNRDGTKSTGGCIYCDPYGSGNGQFSKCISIEEQVENNKRFLKKRYNAEKYFLYFQAFTNTYAPVEKLKEIYDKGIAGGKDDILGIIIGTRPDCIDEEKLKLIASYYPEYEVWIEYGLQSIHQKTLDFINRQHSVDDYLKAVELTRKYPVKIATHIIAGLPYETRDHIMETVRFLVKHNKIDALKIHSLYIPKGSGLEKLYHQKKFDLMAMQEYIQTVVDILEIMPENMIIARLTGEIDKHHLVAPDWVLKKQKVLTGINEEMKNRGLKWGLGSDLD